MAESYQILPKQVIKTRCVKTWTEEEDNILKELHEKYQNDWAFISSKIEGRNSNQCLHRFRRIMVKGNENKKVWTQQQDEKVIQYVKVVGKNWRMISGKIKTKTGKQIRQRYINKLDPEINKQSWSQDEDFQIIKLYKTLGTKWSQISKNMIGRPQNMIKNRFYSYIMKNYEIKQKNSDLSAQKTISQIKLVDQSTSQMDSMEFFNVATLNQLDSMSLSLEILNSSDYEQSILEINSHFI